MPAAQPAAQKYPSKASFFPLVSSTIQKNLSVFLFSRHNCFSLFFLIFYNFLIKLFYQNVLWMLSSFLPFVYRYFHDFSTDSITGNDKVFRFSYFQTNALYKPERMIFQFLPAEILSAIQFYNLPDTFQPKTAFIFFLFCTFHFRICL